MFFFFVGGVEQQAGKVVEKDVGRCIKCGSKADLVNSDNVLKLFFVPVWRWPAKQSLLHCPHCKLFFPRLPLSDFDNDLRCSSCAHLVSPDYRFCPFCGTSL